MSFLYIWYFSQHCPTHHVTPHAFCRRLFQICANCSFSSSLFTIFFIIYLMLISYILFWYIMSKLLTKMLKIEWSISRVTCPYNKSYSKTKLVLDFLDQSLVFQKAFMLLLIISPILIEINLLFQLGSCSRLETYTYQSQFQL